MYKTRQVRKKYIFMFSVAQKGWRANSIGSPSPRVHTRDLGVPVQDQTVWFVCFCAHFKGKRAGRKDQHQPGFLLVWPSLAHGQGLRLQPHQALLQPGECPSELPIQPLLPVTIVAFFGVTPTHLGLSPCLCIVQGSSATLNPLASRCVYQNSQQVNVRKLNVS